MRSVRSFWVPVASDASNADKAAHAPFDSAGSDVDCISVDASAEGADTMAVGSRSSECDPGLATARESVP